MSVKRSQDIPVDEWTSTEFKIDAGWLSISRDMCEVYKPMPEWHPLQCDASNPTNGNLVIHRIADLLDVMVVGNKNLNGFESSVLRDLKRNLRYFLDNIWGKNYDYIYYSDFDYAKIDFENHIYLFYDRIGDPRWRGPLLHHSGPWERVELKYGGWQVELTYYGRGEFFLKFNDFNNLDNVYSFHSASSFRLPGTLFPEGVNIVPRRSYDV